MDRKIRILTTGQLVASALTFAYSLAYPGIMVVITAGVGLLYLITAYYAYKQSRPASWVAFVLSVFTLWIATQLLWGWFDSGHRQLYPLSAWPIETIIVLLMMTVVFLVLLTVVVLHVWCWRWLVFGAQRSPETESIN